MADKELGSSVLDHPTNDKKPKYNKYALACGLLASMTSVLLGYGNNTSFIKILSISNSKIQFLFFFYFFLKLKIDVQILE